MEYQSTGAHIWVLELANVDSTGDRIDRDSDLQPAKLAFIVSNSPVVQKLLVCKAEAEELIILEGDLVE